MKHTALWFIIIVLIVGGVWFFKSERALEPVIVEPSEKLAPETAANPAEMIQVDLSANTQITSPLTITGKARGPWYFEASFPIELQDNNGAVIVMTTAQAQGDWMTEDFVPFTATLTFPAQPAGSLGKIVLKRDNPSGEPQNDASIVVPVQF